MTLGRLCCVVLLCGVLCPLVSPREEEMQILGLHYHSALCVCEGGEGGVWVSVVFEKAIMLTHVSK